MGNEAPHSSALKLLIWNTSNGNFEGSCDVINWHAIHVGYKTPVSVKCKYGKSKTIHFHSEERLMILMIYCKDDELFKI
jgi:hypothetical protein